MRQVFHLQPGHPSRVTKHHALSNHCLFKRTVVHQYLLAGLIQPIHHPTIRATSPLYSLHEAPVDQLHACELRFTNSRVHAEISGGLMLLSMVLPLMILRVRSRELVGLCELFISCHVNRLLRCLAFSGLLVCEITVYSSLSDTHRPGGI